MLDGITHKDEPELRRKITKTIPYWHTFYVTQKLSEYVSGSKKVYYKYELVIYNDKTCESRVVEENVSEEEYFKRHLEGSIDYQK